MSTVRKPKYTVAPEQRHRMFDRLSAELAKEPAATLAYVYGSALDAQAVHDIDIGLLLQESALTNRSALVADLAGRLEATVNIPVDIRIINNAPVTFLFHVFRGHLLLSRDEELLTTMMEEVARRYLDLAPLLRQGTKDAFVA